MQLNEVSRVYYAMDGFWKIFFYNVLTLRYNFVNNDSHINLLEHFEVSPQFDHLTVYDVVILINTLTYFIWYCKYNYYVAV